jgi:hypothetical protein
MKMETRHPVPIIFIVIVSNNRNLFIKVNYLLLRSQINCEFYFSRI